MNSFKNTSLLRRWCLAMVLAGLLGIVLVPSATAQESCDCKPLQQTTYQATSTEDCPWAKMEVKNFADGLCAEGFCSRTIEYCSSTGCTLNSTSNSCDQNFEDGTFHITGIITYSCEDCNYGEVFEKPLATFDPDIDFAIACPSPLSPPNARSTP